MGKPRSRSQNPEHRGKFSTLEMHPALYDASAALAARAGISWAGLVRFLIAREARLHGILFSALGWPSNELLRIEGEIQRERQAIQSLYVQIAQHEMVVAQLVQRRLSVISDGIAADLPPPKAPRSRTGVIEAITGGPVAQALNGSLHALTVDAVAP